MERIRHKARFQLKEEGEKKTIFCLWRQAELAAV